MDAFKALKDHKADELLIIHNKIEELKSEKARLEGAKQQLVSEIKSNDPNFDEDKLVNSNEVFTLKTKIDDNIKKMNNLINTFEKTNNENNENDLTSFTS